MAINPAAMAASLSEVMANLPVILDTLQTITYILLIFFFGSIVLMGFRIYAAWWKKLLLRVVFGFLALFSGTAIAGLMPLPDNILVKLVQVDMLVGGVVASVIFAVSLFILSKALSSEETLKRAIERLQKALKREQARPKPKNTYSSPYFLAGVVIIVLFLLFSAFNFTGFQSFQEDLMSAFGMTKDDFESLENILDDVQGMDIPEGALDGGLPDGIVDGIADMPAGCYELLDAVGRNMEAMSVLTDYSNPQLKATIEQEVGEGVLGMKRANVEGDVVVVAITMNGKTCIATETELCICN